MTRCGNNRKKSLAIRTNHYSAYDNKNGGGRWGGRFVYELIVSDHYQSERIGMDCKR